jgi:hypothetical protein
MRKNLSVRSKTQEESDNSHLQSRESQVKRSDQEPILV